ncbi:hypothetical protein EI982_06105 [Haloplanus rallus]|uniref:Uncharacterized protein n=1 Tax=Haloplanus rallus TaxID=1816183 RepID=A0A6B9FDB0_9EURY|nr:hypothetical protein [Haloplanus rallus]QGX94390.1 hypothetical protein EI982_06105 [Haloplanus rallus]
MSRSPLSRRLPVHHGHHATNPHGERFTVGHADAYSATGSIAVEGEVKLAFQGVVASDGAWYRKVREDAVVSEECDAPRDGTLYRRYTITEEGRAGQLRGRITDDEDGVLVRERREGDRVTFVVGYADDGRPPSGTVRYEPRSGWYD